MEKDASKEIILDMGNRCRNCNYCFTSCPLYHSTRGFISQSPSGLLQSIRYALKWDLLKGSDRTIIRDLLYSCTTCNSCVIRCKSKATGIGILQAIEAGRKVLREMMIGPLPQQRKPLQDIFQYGNPYGEKPEKRHAWLEGLQVKRLPEEKADVLFYVGCTIAHDPALHAMGKSLIRLMTRLNVDFGILEGEICCGDPALRMGDQAVFEELAEKNTGRFLESGVSTIVTASPHCFNTFLNEYPSLADKVKVRHYTEFIFDLLKADPSFLKRDFPHTVTYHDPCYMGKHNQVFETPRKLLQAVGGLKLVEMAMNRNDSLCCGGGGGRMFAEVEEEPRLSRTRIDHAKEAGADVLATACPWCFTMLTNASKETGATGESVRVLDIAQIIEEVVR